MLLSVFISSYIIRIAERPTWKEYSGWDGISPVQYVYMVIITMTTVGYGDYVPLTIIGKIVIVATALWGGFVIGLLIVSVNDIFNLSVTEKIAFDKLAKVRTAAKVIISALRLQVAKKKLVTSLQGSINEDSYSNSVKNSFITKKYNIDRVRINL
jgi:hypothetical protein